MDMLQLSAARSRGRSVAEQQPSLVQQSAPQPEPTKSARPSAGALFRQHANELIRMRRSVTAMQPQRNHRAQTLAEPIVPNLAPGNSECLSEVPEQCLSDDGSTAPTAHGAAFRTETCTVGDAEQDRTDEIQLGR